MLKLKYEPRFFREHPVLTRVLVLGYTAFICCFIFPLGNTASLHLSFFILLIALCLAEAWGPGRAASVFRGPAGGFRPGGGGRRGGGPSGAVSAGVRRGVQHPQFHSGKRPVVPLQCSLGNDRCVSFSREVAAGAFWQPGVAVMA